MIGIDTNILVRYFTQDNLEQAQIVEQVINSYATSPNSLFINNIVMCELIWVLERGYKYSKEAISAVIKQMLSRGFLHIMRIFYFGCLYPLLTLIYRGKMHF